MGNWRMRRRDFVLLAGGVVVAVPFGAQAQQQAISIPHIAYLGASGPATIDPSQIEQFKAGLMENGLIDGQNINVDYLWGEGSLDRLRRHAADLAKGNFAVIVTAGPQPVRALLDARVKSPIVFAILNDPISDGFIQNLARPGGNLTGLSMSGSDLESKRLQILKDAVPALTKVLLLHDPSMGTIGLEEAKRGASTLGLEVVLADLSDDNRFAEAFAGTVSQPVSGVVGMASPFFNFHRKRLVELSLQYQLPSIWEAAAYVRDGGFLSYGPSFSDMYRRSAGYVAKIIRGVHPSELPVEQPTRFELAVNLKTAKALRLHVPPTLLGRADEVTE
jgi:putative tryptophan/tyrosine transport system substrate-binding protein